MLNILKSIIFDKHKYEIGNEEYKKVEKMAHLYNFKNIYFSMYYNDYYRDMIYELKYRKKKYVAKLIFNIVKEHFEYVLKKNNIEYIICVPISNKRKKERGFNQVEEIFADYKYKFLKMQKIKDTKKMSKLKKTYQKNLNIHNTFNVKNLNLDNKVVLIVDDIITTGATIKEIEKEIKAEYINVTIYVYAVSASHNFAKINNCIK